MTQEIVDGSVVKALLKLYPGDIPTSLMRENPVRTEGDFDPNTYFTVLTNLSMKPGYTLDYVYHFIEDFGGSPCLYARPVDEKPLDSYSEHREWNGENNLLSFLVADGTPDSFFQLAVFNKLAGQFYLHWHANYNDLTIVTSRKELETIIADVNRGDFGSKFTEEQASAMRAIDPEPTVELSELIAVVRYCIFSKWGGMARLEELFLRKPPHWQAETNLLAEISYHCGVCY